MQFCFALKGIHKAPADYFRFTISIMACVVFIHENIDGGFFLQEFELIAGYFYVQSKQQC